MSAPHDDQDELAADDALEEIIINDEDTPMDSDSDGDDGDAGIEEEILLQNDSVAYFDGHKDSVFAIAQHPLFAPLVATGGSEGESDDSPGKGYVIDTSVAPSRPVLPASYSAEPSEPAERPGLAPLFEVDGHTDSITTLAFTLPSGDVLLSGGMDGKLRAYRVAATPGQGCTFDFLAEAQEVPEINWLAPCPSPAHPNTVALGASDGSVWVYTVDPNAGADSLEIVQSYFLHTGSCTAGAWTPDGSLLVTVSDDVTLYAWDVWGLAAAQGLGHPNGTAVTLTGADNRFNVDGGLYSLAIEPKGTFAVVGGAGGAIRVISLPRISADSSAQPKAKGGKGKGKSDASAGGQILASLQVQTETVEALAFTSGSAQILLAAGSVDGSIAVFDPARRFAVRKHITGAHEDQAVVKVEFVPDSWLLTSCGMDGVVKRWDLKAGGAGAAAGASAQGLVKEWKGHRGEGEGGGVMGFVQGQTGERVITAGDDGVVLVFEA
ncbi:related to SQT1 Suppresses dominant-negative mutants of the ribosomal protein QSR1 [Cephalotrichum gorgonifer]|uniref:Related to SQT1 Suppresses dominant-negative mutants of the ribosomal protein QSR1 n=1 Tax=Cephalotrichum gorgonifer TaxID=2041049 RepID=A0AAE8MUN4_9PEZI|nr:related to SQT1 Suppresses dominant-negative mutants of the ribosomal protein QSR1 [Cephalotrichum gorgonifer]